MRTPYLIASTLIAAGLYYLWPACSATSTNISLAHAPASEPRSDADSLELFGSKKQVADLGVWRRYSLDFRAAATFDPDSVNARRVELSVQGQWKATRSGNDLYELQVEHAHVELAGADQSALEIEAALEHPHYMRLDSSGHITEFFTSADTDPATWRVWFAIASYMQFSPGEGDEWTSAELDPAGEYAAEYARVGADQYEKRKLQYLRVRADGGWVPQRELNLGIDGVTQVTRRGHGLPQTVQGSETSWTESKSALVAVSVKTDVSLSLSESGVDDDAVHRFEKVRAGLVAGLDAPASSLQPSGPRRSFAALVEQLDAGIESPSLLIEGFALALAHEPDAIGKVLELLRNEPERDPGNVLLAALGSAGTTEAQSALREIAQDSSVSDMIASEAIVEMGRTLQPNEASIALLIETVDDPRPMFSSTAALSLGNAVDHLGASESGKLALAKLLAKLAGARSTGDTLDVLAALGNSASPDALPAITPFLHAANEDLRSAAVDALKLIPDQTVAGLISERLSLDDATVVRARAAYAMGYRTGSLAFESLASSLRREDNVEVRGEALASAAQVGAGSPQAQELLQWVAEHDASEKLRARAQQLL